MSRLGHRPGPDAGLLALLAAALGVAAMAGCSDVAAGPSGAFTDPIDFAYACEGDGATVLPELDERPAEVSEIRVCPDLPGGGGRAHLVGMVLGSNPAGVHVLQMNRASGEQEVLDAELFTPGFTAIPVAEGPLRILRASDASAFYVISASPPTVTRIVVEGIQGPGGLRFTTSSFPLPGPPADAIMVGDHLVVSSAIAPELFSLDLGTDPVTPSTTSIAVKDEVARMQHHDGALLVTWRDLPLVSVLDAATGAVLREAGIRPECSDTLDNDGDGLVDHEDADCRYGGDPTESGSDGEDARAVFVEVALDLCGDDLDNDGDGKTDLADPSCHEDPPQESVPECADGVDNDNDGLVDTDDESCYGPADLIEGERLAYGPYGATSVDAREVGAGLWVYAVDPERARIVVFEDNGTTLARLSQPTRSVDVPPAFFLDYSDASALGDLLADGGVPSFEVSAATPIRIPGHPSLGRGDARDRRMVAPLLPNLSASRIRGELWSRVMEADAETGQPTVALDLPAGGPLYRPPGCEPFAAVPAAGGTSGVCVQPAWDDATWYVFAPRLDGRIQLLEAVRRGVPVHRYVQDFESPSLRGTDVSKPTLSRRGRPIAVGASLKQGYPFLGPLAEEQIAEGSSGESPDEFRRWGVFPAADPERVESQTWRLSYEGLLPGTAGVLAWLDESIDGTWLYDPRQRFCERGVEVGDWLVLLSGFDEGLHQRTRILLEDGLECPTAKPDVGLIEVKVLEVGQTGLRVDLASARTRPPEPALDDKAIAEAKAAGTKGLSLSECNDVLDEVKDSLTHAANLETRPDLAVSDLPDRISYQVRADGVYTVVGSRSGLLHRWVWLADPIAGPGSPGAAGGQCVEDEGLDPLFRGRLEEAEATAEGYDTCPPSLDVLAHDVVDEALPQTGERFETFAFAVDVFPGCELDDEGAITLVETQRDTRWTFVASGPDNPDSTAGGGSLLSHRLPLLDFQRNIVQLDTGSGRVHVLEFQPGDVDIEATFE